MSGWLEARGVRHQPSVAVAFAENLEAGDEDETEAADGLSALSIPYSVFPDVKAESITRKEMCWGDIVSVLMAPKERASKEDCPLLKLATFGDKRTGKNCLRSDGNMLAVFGIEGDYDGEEVSVDEATARLAKHGIEALIYTSASHGVVAPPRSNGGPRWRVLAPLSQAHSPDERRRLVAMLNYALDGILASESFTPSQTYYFGRVRGVEYEARHVAGQAIDQLDLVLDEIYATSGQKEKAPSTGGSDDLDRMAALADVTAETITDLRSTIPFFSAADADDYQFWVPKFGHALASLKETEFAEEAREIWHEFSAKSPHYDTDETEAKWEGINPSESTYRSIFGWAAEPNRGWKNPRSNTTPKTGDQYATRIDHTDTGNANLLAQLTDGNLRYVPDRRLWLWWDGGRWVADDHGSLAHQAALRVARHYHNKAAELAQKASDPVHDDDGRKKLEKTIEALRKWEKHCRNKRTIDAMLATAAKDQRFHVSVAQLDRDPWLLGVENGVVDLRTGAIRATARDEFVTKRSPFRFDPAATAPRWCKFIEEITGAPEPGGSFTQRPALAAYLHRGLGYSLTGSVAEQKMFVCIGGGSNGKNVLLDMFQWIAGDYCRTIQPDALMATKHSNDAERPSPAAASLAGARAAHCSESKDGQKLDVALVKRHTGGGYMTARLMRENTFRFEITHKLWLMTNHRPALDHLDDAMKGRLHLIPFDRKWNRPGHPERDPNLPEGDKDLMTKLRAEAEGVLAWLVAGAVAYSQEGVEPPGEVSRMTRDYFMDQDALGRWLEQFKPCDTKDGELAGDLFDAFVTWCSDEGIDEFHPSNQTSFSLELRRRGHERRKGKDGMRYGLRTVSGSKLVTGDGL
ncbi:MAG: phage/plasmid primase, P4 family [Rhodocyclales bacterium]|nr:phage/plasmid primase, P4 family [Rhodocyclales bacterium]